MLTYESALEIVYSALKSLNEELDEPLEIAPETCLFGADAQLDSLSLVSVVVDVETEASDVIGKPISLTDDRAISEPISPFSTPKALATYIAKLAAE